MEVMAVSIDDLVHIHDKWMVSTIVTNITTNETRLCLTTEIHIYINIIFNFKDCCICILCFGNSHTSYTFYMLVQLVAGQSLYTFLYACFPWHFCMPSGQRFIIIWFSSHLISRFMNFRRFFFYSFYLCMYEKPLFQFRSQFQIVFITLTHTHTYILSVSLKSTDQICWKVAFHHLIISVI